jgi:hypothetical protein
MDYEALVEEMIHWLDGFQIHETYLANANKNAKFGTDSNQTIYQLSIKELMKAIGNMYRNGGVKGRIFLFHDDIAEYNNNLPLNKKAAIYILHMFRLLIASINEDTFTNSQLVKLEEFYRELKNDIILVRYEKETSSE